MNRPARCAFSISRQLLILMITLTCVAGCAGHKAIVKGVPDDMRDAIPAFSRPTPTKIVFEDSYWWPCPKGLLCHDVSRVSRFVVLIRIEDAKSRKPDVKLMDRAEQQIIDSFSGAAREALGKFTDTTATEWEDIEDTVCRAHQRKPSFVLPAPYFEKVEYCIRLIKGPKSYGDLRAFRMSSEATVSVTKNPDSGYRDPSSGEMTRFGEVLVGLTVQVRSKLLERAKQNGWHVAKVGEEEVIDGIAK